MRNRFHGFLFATAIAAATTTASASYAIVAGGLIYNEPFSNGAFVGGVNEDISLTETGWKGEYGPTAASSLLDWMGGANGTVGEGISRGRGTEIPRNTLDIEIHNRVNAGAETLNNPDGIDNGFAFFRNLLDADDLNPDPVPSAAIATTDEFQFEFSGAPVAGGEFSSGPTLMEFWARATSADVKYHAAMKVDGEWYIHKQATSFAKQRDWHRVLIPIDAPMPTDRTRHWISGAYTEGAFLEQDLASVTDNARRVALPLGTVEGFGIYATTPDNGARARFDSVRIHGFTDDTPDDAVFTTGGGIIYREPFSNGAFVGGLNEDLSLSEFGWTAEYGASALGSPLDWMGGAAGTVGEGVSRGRGAEFPRNTLDMDIHNRVNAGPPTLNNPDGVDNGFAFVRNQLDVDDLVTEAVPSSSIAWTDEFSFNFQGLPTEGFGVGPTAVEFLARSTSEDVTYHVAMRVDGEWYVNAQGSSFANGRDWTRVLVPIAAPEPTTRLRNWISGVYEEGVSLVQDLTTVDNANRVALPLGTVDAFGVYMTTPDNGARARFDNFTVYGIVPEPTSAALLGAGLLGFMISQRRGATSSW